MGENGAGTTNRTRDLLITNLCNNSNKSIRYESYFHKAPSKHTPFYQCFGGIYS